MDARLASRLIFDEARRAIMAHSIRAAINRFSRKGVELDLRVLPDIGLLLLENPKELIPSLMLTRLYRSNRHSGRNRVVASIIINRDANIHLARLCIAKHIYCLLLELDAYEESGRKQWKEIPHTEKLERESDQFAWELCRLHDSFYRDEETRSKFVNFPPHLFDKPFIAGKGMFGMPADWAFDSQQPFNTKISL